jgi:hypothetical protein
MKTDETSAPIFIFGSGRSGTTLLYDLMRRHPDVAWVSRLTDRFPVAPQLSFASRFAALRRYRLFAPSTDSINAYRHCGLTIEMLAERNGSLTEEDATPDVVARLRHMADAHARWMGANRFINKSTMNSMRLRLINHAFPDARFVHIIRNGYAVASSLVRVSWWPDTTIWWKNTTPRRWEAAGGDPYELAALNWRRQMTEIRTHQPHIPAERFFECRFEDLASDAHALVERIAAFCGLDMSDRFRHNLSEVRVVTGNTDKWRDQLDDHAKETITRHAGDMIEALGYQRLT